MATAAHWATLSRNDGCGQVRSAIGALPGRSADTAALFEERLFEPDIARSHPGKPPSGVGDGVGSWLWDKLTYFL